MAQDSFQNFLMGHYNHTLTVEAKIMAGGGVLTLYGSILGMRNPKEYGFLAVLVRNNI